MIDQSGNALFIILIAVALFAALSYAVTQSSGGGAGIDKETRQLTAASTIQMFAANELAMQRFEILSGYSIEEMDFVGENSLFGDNTNCSSDECNFFSPDGGGATPPNLPLSAGGAAMTSGCGNSTYGIRYRTIIGSVAGLGSDAPEVMLHWCGLDHAFCEDINKGLGIQKSGEAPIQNLPGSNGSQYAVFDGDMSTIPTTTVDHFGSLDARITGQTIFCSEDSQYGRLYQVIKIR